MQQVLEHDVLLYSHVVSMQYIVSTKPFKYLKKKKKTQANVLQAKVSGVKVTEIFLLNQRTPTATLNHVSGIPTYGY